jgi:hypothetical protein
VNRAVMGDVSGAVEDFRLFVAQAPDGLGKKRRMRWIGALRSGVNLFTAKELAQLRQERNLFCFEYVALKFFK